MKNFRFNALIVLAIAALTMSAAPKKKSILSLKESITDEAIVYPYSFEINKEKDKINIEKGKRVRVHGGPFDQVEGYFIKVAKKRGRQLVVIIPDLLAVSAEVKPEYIQIID